MAGKLSSQLKQECQKLSQQLSSGQVTDLCAFEAKVVTALVSILSDKNEFMPISEIEDHSGVLVQGILFELLVKVACLKRDMKQFPIAMAQLKHYYENTKINDVSPDFPNRYEMLGLNLMYLLSQNHLSEFHMELQRIPTEILANNSFIMVPIKLEQYLVGGMYNKIFQSKEQLPSKYYTVFMDIVLPAVRNEIANCIERSNSRLKIKEAARMLFMEGPNAEQDVKAFGNKKNWKCNGNCFVFDDNLDKNHEITLNSSHIIGQFIDYAKQLDMIV